MLKEEKSPIKLVTEYREAQVVVGGNIYLSIEDARGILATTDLVASKGDGFDESESRRIGFVSRDILRNMAKAILFGSGGSTTDEEDLLNKFKLKNL